MGIILDKFPMVAKAVPGGHVVLTTTDYFIDLGRKYSVWPLTFGLAFWAGVLRVQVVRRGTVKARDIALGQPGWPEQATKVINAYHNQLELPFLYYLLIVMVMVVSPATPGVVLLSWLFVISRLFHALIHVTTNNVSRRFFVFLAGSVLFFSVNVLGIDRRFIPARAGNTRPNRRGQGYIAVHPRACGEH